MSKKKGRKVPSSNAPANPPAEPAKKRSGLPRYGMRAIFFLVALAALLAWWVRGEMLAEQRREELIAEFSKAGNVLQLRPNNAPSWRQRLVAWLRRKPVPPDVLGANMVFSIPNAAEFVEFTQTFPTKFTWLQIKPSEATPEVIDALAKCESIGHLSIMGTIDSSDESLARLAKIQNDAGLGFGVERVDDALLKRIAEAGVRCNNLYDSDATFERSWREVTDEGLRSAAKLTQLRHLTANRKATDEGLAAFRGHTGITELGLVGPGYTDASADIVASIPNLYWLSLFDTKLTDEAMAKAISGHDLRNLILGNVDVGEKTAEAIAQLKSLSTVELKNVQLSPVFVAALTKCPIGYLEIQGDYDDQAIAGLEPLAPNLTSLTLASPPTTDAGLAWIGKAPKLTSLMLRDTSVTSETFRALPGNVAVSSLGLGGPYVNKEMLAELKAIPALSDVSLYGESIDDEAIAALPPTIRALQLMGTKVTLGGLKAFVGEERPLIVFVWYPEGSEPPFPQKEIDDLKTSTAGLLQITLQTTPKETYQDMLPKWSRMSQ